MATTSDGPAAQSSLKTLFQVLKKTAGKCVSVGGVLLKWGVIAHCTLEYIGDFVIVSGLGG